MCYNPSAHRGRVRGTCIGGVYRGRVQMTRKGGVYGDVYRGRVQEGGGGFTGRVHCTCINHQKFLTFLFLLLILIFGLGKHYYR